jgi:hypothetical protein
MRDFRGSRMYWRTSRRRRSSAWVVIGSCLGVYVVLASLFNWLVAPTLAKNAAAHQPPAASAAQHAAAPLAAVPYEGPAPDFFRPDAAKAPAKAAASEPAEQPRAVAPKKKQRKQVARPATRQAPPANAWSPWNSYASSPYGEYRRSW